MKKNISFILLFGFLALVMAACSPLTVSLGSSTQVPVNTPAETPIQPALREAQVDSVEIALSQSNPPAVSVIVRGSLSESCATLTQPQTRYESGTFYITLMSSSPAERGCAQMITPFEQTIPLDTAGLAPGAYTVIANKVSATFSLPGEGAQPSTAIHLVVQAYDRSVRVVDVSLPSNSPLKPFFNGFLPAGGSVGGIGYVIDPNNPDALAVGSKGAQVIEFVKSPTIYGLVVWQGDGTSQPRIAWATQTTGQSQASSIQVSNLDGSQIDTLLTQDTPNPPTQLVPEFWSTDGKTLYFSKEPLGLGGNILFGGGSSLYSIDTNTKEVSEVIPLGPSDGPQACLDSISADFRYVADHCAQNSISVRDLQYGTSSPIQPPSEVPSYNFTGGARFSPSGNHLAYALAKTDQGSEQGWIALTQLNGGSKVILTSEVGTIYSLAGWLDDQTLLVQSTNVQQCIPDCATQLWGLNIDGSAPTKLADGRFLALITGDLQTVPPPAGAPAQPAACKDAAEYVSDDGLDGTTYTPNTAFTKTWTVKNIGTCTWDSTYLVYQLSGELMTQQPGYWLVPQGQTVQPGEAVDVSVGMTAPPENGSYRADWLLKDGQGQVIPLKGGTSDNSFYVEIKVNDGTANGEVTATAIDIVQEQGSGEICSASATYFVHAYITTDGPALVDYEIDSTAGQIAAGYFEVNGESLPYVKGTLEFAKAEKQAINLRFIGPYPYPDNISVMLKADGGEWITTKLICP